MAPSDVPEESPEVRLKDLRAGQPPVHVLGRVVTVSRKEITGRADGRRRTVLSGLMTDGTATVRFTWWDPPADGVDRGTVLRAVHAQVREFRQKPELSFGWSTKIQPASDLELPSPGNADLPLRGVAELQPRDEGFQLEVRVVEVTERTVTVGEERRAIHSGLLADGSGSARFTAWVDFRLKPGDTVRVAGGYVRLFRGNVEVTLDERSLVESISPDRVPHARSPSVPLRSLGALAGGGGGADVRTEGIVVGLGSPSGVVQRCANCGRVLRDQVCRLHGAVDGTPDLRARVILDDGTGVATVNFAREQTERLTGQSMSHLMDSVGRGPDPLAVEREIQALLLGRRLRVQGSARVDEFGLSLYPTSYEEIVPQPGPAVDALARRLAERTR